MTLLLEPPGCHCYSDGGSCFLSQRRSRNPFHSTKLIECTHQTVPRTISFLSGNDDHCNSTRNHRVRLWPFWEVKLDCSGLLLNLYRWRYSYHEKLNTLLRHSRISCYLYKNERYLWQKRGPTCGRRFLHVMVIGMWLRTKYWGAVRNTLKHIDVEHLYLFISTASFLELYKALVVPEYTL